MVNGIPPAMASHIDWHLLSTQDFTWGWQLEGALKQSPGLFAQPRVMSAQTADPGHG